MKILITGGSGMLARTLIRRLPQHEIRAFSRAELDVTRLCSLTAVLTNERPQAVIHCAAHTKVDLCETDIDRAFAINAVGSTNVAIACQRAQIRLIAISTDYVFPGDLNRPYHEWDEPGPRTVYGSTKLAGEIAIRHHCPEHVIARVAWLYGAGGPSFVHTMLKLGQQPGPAIKVVNDQHGSPTCTDVVADALLPFLAIDGPVGTFHMACSGDATWYEFARELFRLSGSTRELVPCSSSEYPRAAHRPANSRLEARACRLHGLPAIATWQNALASFLHEFPTG